MLLLLKKAAFLQKEENGNKMKEIKRFQISSRYKLRYELARYLSKVNKSKDSGEFKAHELELYKMCLGEFEYQRAIKCLKDIMRGRNY